MPGIAGRRALVQVTGSPVAFTGTGTISLDNQTYALVLPQVPWDRATQPVVKNHGTPTAEAYTFNRLNGTVTFATVDGTRVVTVDGKYLPTSVAVGADKWSLSLTCEALDSTDFDSANTNGNLKTFERGMKDASGSIGRKLSIDHYFDDALLAGAPVVVVVSTDRDDYPFLLMWALLSKDQIDASIDAISTGSVDFTGTADDQGVVVSRPFIP